jgi:hypothetical protein
MTMTGRIGILEIEIVTAIAPRTVIVSQMERSEAAERESAGQEMEAGHDRARMLIQMKIVIDTVATARATATTVEVEGSLAEATTTSAVGVAAVVDVLVPHVATIAAMTAVVSVPVSPVVMRTVVLSAGALPLPR